MHGRCRWGGRHSTYSLHRKKRKMPLSAQWSEQNYKWMQPSAKCLCWLHFSDKIEFNNKTTTLSHRLYALLACLFVGQFVCLFKVCRRDSRLPLVLFNLSDVWWNPNVFNFTVSSIHSAGLHRCDGVRWPGYFELRPLTNFPPEQVWPPGPHISCEAAHGHQRDVIWPLRECQSQPGPGTDTWAPCHSHPLSSSFVTQLSSEGLNQYYLSCRSWWIPTRPWHTLRENGANYPGHKEGGGRMPVQFLTGDQ